MSSQQLFVRLDALQTSIKESLQHIQRLAILQPDDLDNQDTTSDSFRADLTAEIHDSLKQQEDDLEMINQDVEDVVTLSGQDGRSSRRSGHIPQRDQDRDRDNTELLSRTSRVGDELKLYVSSKLCIFKLWLISLSARIRFRKAQLQAKRNADLAQERERAAYISSLQAAAESLAKEQEASEEQPHDSRTPAELRNALFAGRRPGSRNPKQTQEDMVLGASADLTSSLRRTHALLTDEVSRSRFAHETLEESNAALKELNERYNSLDDLLGKSKSLLKVLVKSQKSDTWYLQTALYILIATICWLIFRKIIYGPAWWVVFFTIRLPFRMSWFVASTIWAVTMTTKNGTSVMTTQDSLRIMPSASGKPPAFSKRGQQVYMPAGAGGQGAKVGTESHTPMSDMVSKMVEASRVMGDVSPSMAAETAAKVTEGASGESSGQGKNQQDQAGQAPAGQAAEVRRGDGQVLPERDEQKQPRNPKKRMMEVPPEPPVQQRDEL
jgi:protein transport protein SEC20